MTKEKILAVVVHNFERPYNGRRKEYLMDSKKKNLSNEIHTKEWLFFS